MTEQLPEMTADLADLNARLKQAVGHGQLIESSAQNIQTLLEGASSADDSEESAPADLNLTGDVSLA